MTVKHLKPRFVDAFPDTLDEGVLYVALEYSTMSHLCACGCRSEVVTPLSPNDWEFAYDGVDISVNPSIGSWSLPCESHYVIKKGAVRWADKWDNATIQAGRERDLARKRRTSAPPSSPPSQQSLSGTARPSVPPPPTQGRKPTLWQRIKQGLGLD